MAVVSKACRHGSRTQDSQQVEKLLLLKLPEPKGYGFRPDQRSAAGLRGGGPDRPPFRCTSFQSGFVVWYDAGASFFRYDVR